MELLNYLKSKEQSKDVQHELPLRSPSPQRTMSPLTALSYSTLSLSSLGSDQSSRSRSRSAHLERLTGQGAASNVRCESNNNLVNCCSKCYTKMILAQYKAIQKRRQYHKKLKKHH